MHPILNHRGRLAIYALVWMLMGLLLALGFRVGGVWLSAGFFVPLSLAYGAASLSAWYVCRAFPLGEGSTTRGLLLAHVLAALLISVAWVALAAPWARALDALASTTDAHTFYSTQWPLLFVVGVLLFWLTATFYYLLTAFEASRDAEQRALSLSLLAREAELKALRAQIDPHFIFNSLHSISALTASNPAAARTMCLLLADFLRDTLRLGERRTIPLEEELSLAERFLAIEQVRLGARLQVTRDIQPEALPCLVPSLLLQPLVENAVVHGIAQLVEGGTIGIAAVRSGSMLQISLENPCDPDRTGSRGVGLGLALLRQRLTTEFGAYDAVSVDERDGRFRVEVRLPAVIGGAAT